MTNKIRITLVIIFSLIFIAGLVSAFYIPEYADYKLDDVTEKYTVTNGQFTSIDTATIDRLAPSCEMSGILISAGLQLLGISGIFATIIKKDN